MSKKLTLQQFVEKANIIHNNKYDYSLVCYINDITKVLILCPRHGEFLQVPNSHYKSGCPDCGLIKRSSRRKNKISDIISEFQNKFGDLYDYSKVDYVKMRNKVIIKCNKHNIEFQQSPMKHLESKTGGCPKCNSIGKGKLTNEEFIYKANLLHNNRYDYSLICDFNYNKKVSIICEKHGVFQMSPNAHLRGQGCRNCNRNGGKIENIWLDTYNIPKDYRQFKIGKFFVDGVDINNKLVYEFYGDFWHGNPKVYNKNDINRVNGLTFGELYNRTITRQMEIEKIGYKIISIWESDYKDSIKNNYKL